MLTGINGLDSKTFESENFLEETNAVFSKSKFLANQCGAARHEALQDMKHRHQAVGFWEKDGVIRPASKRRPRHSPDDADRALSSRKPSLLTMTYGSPCATSVSRSAWSMSIALTPGLLFAFLVRWPSAHVASKPIISCQRHRYLRFAAGC